MTPRQFLLFLPIILFLSLSFKCGSGTTAAKLHRDYSRAIDDLNSNLSTVESTSRQLEENKNVPHEMVLRLLMQISQLRASVQAATAGGPLSQAIASVASSLDEMDKTVAQIEDSVSKVKLQESLRSLRTSSAALANISALAASKCHDVGGGCVICDNDPCTYCPGIPPTCP